MPWGNYDVVDTDYENYSVVYSCTNFLFGLYRSEYAWILTRSHSDLDPEKAKHYEKLGREILERDVPGYDTSHLRRTLHGK